MTALADLRFVLTPGHPCSYLPGREARTLFVDPAATLHVPLYQQLSHVGFRRSGSYVYRPACAACTACIATRVIVADFAPRRRHRRLRRRNSDLRVQFSAAAERADLYALYARYIEQRHADGDMYPPTPDQFRTFLLGTWSDTRMLILSERERPLAVGVVDVLDDGLSAVYSFFDPDETARSLGTHLLLAEIDLARELGLPFVYLGYWVKGCRKMNYKIEFGPLELFIENRWQRVN